MLVPDLPEAFEHRLRQQYPQAHQSIREAFNEDAVISVRYNPHKSHPIELNKPVPWANLSCYLDHRPNFSEDPLFHAGAFYPQEASSLALEQVWMRIATQIRAKRVLDLCAAPGGKSTHLLSLMDEDGVLLSNEIVPKRYSILNENLIKWGHPNFITSNYRPNLISQLEAIFDVVLVDAPCSGEGLFRKQVSWREEWSNEYCDLCVNRQQKILNSAIQNIRSGGFLIYSTCTLNPEENLNQISRLTQNYGFDSIEIPDLEEFGFIKEKKNAALGYQALPHRVKGEPFFISCLQKTVKLDPVVIRRSQKLYIQLKDAAIKLNSRATIYEKKELIYGLNDAQRLLANWMHDKGLRYFIPSLANYKKTNFIPSHFSAMHIHSRMEYPALEVNYIQALAYLRHESIKLNVPEKGWYLINFQGVDLGWIKFDGRRIINKYPIKWRLRS